MLWEERVLMSLPLLLRDAPIEWGDGDRDGDLDVDGDSFIRETERWNSRVANWRSSCLYRISNCLNSTDVKVE